MGLFTQQRSRTLQWWIQERNLLLIYSDHLGFNRYFRIKPIKSLKKSKPAGFYKTGEVRLGSDGHGHLADDGRTRARCRRTERSPLSARFMVWHFRIRTKNRCLSLSLRSIWHKSLLSGSSVSSYILTTAVAVAVHHWCDGKSKYEISRDVEIQNTQIRQLVILLQIFFNILIHGFTKYLYISVNKCHQLWSKRQKCNY